jgi:hypothetical protein
MRVMRSAVLVLILTSAAFSADKPACVIIRHASTSRQIWVSGANWQYVEGDFPKGMKWKSDVTDRTVRKVKELGGRVVTIPNVYTTADLEDARKQCKAEDEPAHPSGTAVSPK